MVVIPGGMTAYLQAGDLCYYKPFKDVLNTFIEDWKGGPLVQYTPRGNPRPPEKALVNDWVRRAWKCVREDLVLKGLLLSGVLGSVADTFIARHDVYGKNVMDAWNEMLEAEQQALTQDTAAEDPEDETAILDSDDDSTENFSKFKKILNSKIEVLKKIKNFRNLGN